MVDTVTLNEASGPSTPDDTSDGIPVIISSADGGATSGSGADIRLQCGSAPTNGDGGGLSLSAGNGGLTFGFGGNLFLSAGSGTTDGRGGSSTIRSGDGIGTNRNAGNIEIITGNASLKNGGDINFTFGTAGSVAGRNGLFFPNLPTVNPAVAGAAWSDAGTVKISAG